LKESETQRLSEIFSPANQKKVWDSCKKLEKQVVKNKNKANLPGVCNVDGFVKSPFVALRCILSHCGVQVSTPHSVGFARLASGAFYCAV
jgi:hypothetical protein